MVSLSQLLNCQIPKGRKLPHNVQVYQLQSDAGRSEHLAQGLSVLETKDRKRWHKIRSSQDRQNFLLSRLLLIEILRRDWGIESAKLTYTAKGKPKLKPGPAISWSHSKNHIVVAVGDVAALGADIESTTRRISNAVMGRILSRYSDANEMSHFQAASSIQKTALFYKLWCEKESFAKCTGHGLGAQLKNHRIEPYEFYTLSGVDHCIAVCVKPFAESRVQQYKVRK